MTFTKDKERRYLETNPNSQLHGVYRIVISLWEVVNSVQVSPDVQCHLICQIYSTLSSLLPLSVIIMMGQVLPPHYSTTTTAGWLGKWNYARDNLIVRRHREKCSRYVHPRCPHFMNPKMADRRASSNSQPVLKRQSTKATKLYGSKLERRQPPCMRLPTESFDTWHCSVLQFDLQDFITLCS